MAAVPLVNEQIDDGQKLLARLVEDGFPVATAAWVLESDGLMWYLYIVSPIVKGKGGRNDYKRLRTAIRELQKNTFWIDPGDVKLIGPRDDVARDILAFRDRRGYKLPAWYRGSNLGLLEIEAAYVYAPLAVHGPSDVTKGVA